MTAKQLHDAMRDKGYSREEYTFMGRETWHRHVRPSCMLRVKGYEYRASNWVEAIRKVPPSE